MMTIVVRIPLFSEVMLRYPGFRYLSGLAWTFVAQSSQQTVIVFPSTSAISPSSLIANRISGTSSSSSQDSFQEKALLSGARPMIAGDISAPGDPICADSSGSSVPGAEWGCFQNRAHFTNVFGSKAEAKCAGRYVEFTAKSVAEMAVARKTERKSQCR